MDAETMAELGGIHRRIAGSHPALRRGLVKCAECGRTEVADTARCLAGTDAWPACCGSTMALESPPTETGPGR